MRASQYSRSAWFSERSCCFCRHFRNAASSSGFSKRLGQVIERAEPDGFDDRGHFVRAGKHDHVEAAVHLHQLAQRFQPVHLRHQHVENDELGPFALADAFERFLAAGHRFHFEAIHFEQRLKILANARFVVHDQNLVFMSHLFSCRTSRKRLLELSAFWAEGTKTNFPRPSSLSTQIFPRCAWISRFVIASPRPIPEDEGSTRTNSSKIS